MGTDTDQPVRNEKKIYYDKGRFRINLEFLALCLFLDIYFIIFVDFDIKLWIASAIIAAFIYYNYTLYKDRQPQIIISKDGIQTSDTRFFKWSEIQNCEVEEVYRGRGYTYYLSYTHPDGKERRDIDKLNIEHEQLAALINYYSNLLAK